MTAKFLLLLRHGQIILARPSSKTLVESLYEKYISGYHHFNVPSSWSSCHTGKVDSTGLKINGLGIHFFAVRGSLALEK